MRQILTLLCLCFIIHISADAQVLSLEPMKRVKLRKAEMPSGQYSGIANMSDTIYAVVHDKSDDVFFLTISSNLKEIQHSTVNAGIGKRDAEGIAYNPSTATLFIAGEADQRIIEYTAEGQPTGRELTIPKEFSKSEIRPNAGFESLTYNAATNHFWTTTEQGLKSEPIGTVTLLSFDGTTLLPDARYRYQCDEPRCHKPTSSPSTYYAYGIPDLLALDDGTLIVMERELYVPKKKVGGWCTTKLYHFTPADGTKRLLNQFTTHLRLTQINLANYEGICVGPTLADGTPTIMLINDSQGGAGNSVARLHEYLKLYKIKLNNNN